MGHEREGLIRSKVRAVMSLYDGAKTRVRVGCAHSKEFEVKVGVHQGSMLSPPLFAIVVDEISENARVWLMNYYMQMTLLSWAKNGRLEGRFWNWKDALKVMV